MSQHPVYACIHAAEFPAQAMLRLRPELHSLPCAILQGDPPLQRVCSLNTRARRLGIRHGMTRIEVDTFPSATVLRRSTAEERSAQAAMLECASLFTPRIEDQSTATEFVCVLDLSGTARLHGSSRQVGASMHARFAERGYSVSIALASNVEAARALARGISGRNRLTIIGPGEERSALASLPISVLQLTPTQAETFSLWGIHTLGMLAELPEAPLVARMGQPGRRLQQIACGTLPHTFVPAEPAFALDETLELDSPVEQLESLLFVAGRMLELLVTRAAQRALALASITVTISLEGGRSHARTVRPALPTNDRTLWLKLLHLDLEAHSPNAAILAVRLSAEPGQTGKVQLGLFSPQLPEAGRLDVTLARIRAIVGDDAVGSPVLTDSHRAEAFRMQPFTVAAASGTSVPSSLARAPVMALRRLRPPESTTVTLQNHQPASFFFRQTHYDVDRAYGPWLASGDWWAQEEHWGREQWDLVARTRDGTLLCCCLIRDLLQNRWQMEALYD